MKKKQVFSSLFVFHRFFDFRRRKKRERKRKKIDFLKTAAVRLSFF